MKAVILVAGQSVRMGKLTLNSHKTLLPVQDKPILDWMLNALQKNGINDVIFVCGFHKEQLISYVANKFPELNSEWIENPVYTETNTAYSFFLTKDSVLNDLAPTLLINGDVILDSRAIAATIASGNSNQLATRFDRVAEEEVKVRLDGDKRIIEIGKHIKPSEAAGESVGINLLSTDTLPRLFDTIEDRINNGNGRKEFYEHSFNDMIEKGEPYYTADVTALPVMEVDTPEDYEAMQHNIEKRLI